MRKKIKMIIKKSCAEGKEPVFINEDEDFVMPGDAEPAEKPASTVAPTRTSGPTSSENPIELEAAAQATNNMFNMLLRKEFRDDKAGRKDMSVSAKPGTKKSTGTAGCLEGAWDSSMWSVALYGTGVTGMMLWMKIFMSPKGFNLITAQRQIIQKVMATLRKIPRFANSGLGQEIDNINATVLDDMKKGKLSAKGMLSNASSSFRKGFKFVTWSTIALGAVWAVFKVANKLGANSAEVGVDALEAIIISKVAVERAVAEFATGHMKVEGVPFYANPCLHGGAIISAVTSIVLYKYTKAGKWSGKSPTAGAIAKNVNKLADDIAEEVSGIAERFIAQRKKLEEATKKIHSQSIADAIGGSKATHLADDLIEKYFILLKSESDDVARAAAKNEFLEAVEAAVRQGEKVNQDAANAVKLFMNESSRGIIDLGDKMARAAAGKTSTVENLKNYANKIKNKLTTVMSGKTKALDDVANPTAVPETVARETIEISDDALAPALEAAAGLAEKNADAIKVLLRGIGSPGKVNGHAYLKELVELSKASKIELDDILIDLSLKFGSDVKFNMSEAVGELLSAIAQLKPGTKIDAGAIIKALGGKVDEFEKAAEAVKSGAPAAKETASALNAAVLKKFFNTDVSDESLGKAIDVVHGLLTKEATTSGRGTKALMALSSVFVGGLIVRLASGMGGKPIGLPSAASRTSCSRLPSVCRYLSNITGKKAGQFLFRRDAESQIFSEEKIKTLLRSTIFWNDKKSFFKAVTTFGEISNNGNKQFSFYKKLVMSPPKGDSVQKLLNKYSEIMLEYHRDVSQDSSYSQEMKNQGLLTTRADGETGDDKHITLLFELFVLGSGLKDRLLVYLSNRTEGEGSKQRVNELTKVFAPEDNILTEDARKVREEWISLSKGFELGQEKQQENKFMDNKTLKQIVSEVISENHGKGYTPYPYHSHIGNEEEEAADFVEDWKDFEMSLVRDESRNTAIEVAKILVKDLELFGDVLDLVGQNQSVATEILKNMRKNEEKA